jgi:hypothetical protein
VTAPSACLRSRWIKPAVYLVLIGGVCWSAWGVIAQHRLDARIREWTALATEKDLLYSDRQLCLIPGFETNPIGRVFMGRRHVMVVAYRDTDVDAILEMPECPVRLVVFLGPQLPGKHAERLRERFGPENVE